MTRNVTYNIDPFKEPLIRSLLASAGYSLGAADHAYWRARKGRSTATIYRTEGRATPQTLDQAGYFPE